MRQNKPKQVVIYQCLPILTGVRQDPAFVKVVVASLHAATSIESGMARSGFNQTTFPNTQLRVAPDQRFG